MTTDSSYIRISETLRPRDAINCARLTIGA